MDMYLDIVFMLELARAAQKCDEIICHKLAISPCELDQLKVHSKEPGHMLRSTIVAELSAIAEDGGKGKVSQDVLDLKELHENALPKDGRSSSSAAGVLPGVVGGKVEDEEDEHEYDFEQNMRLQVKAALSKLHADDDRNHVALEALEEVQRTPEQFEQEQQSLFALIATARQQRQAPASQPSGASSPAHMAWLDSHIHRDTNPRYHVVKDAAGRVLGQLHPMVMNDDGPRCFALCHCKKHKTRCSRSRGWTVARSAKFGEEPSIVNRVLAYFLLSADKFPSTELHMNATRH